LGNLLSHGNINNFQTSNEKLINFEKNILKKNQRPIIAINFNQNNNYNVNPNNGDENNNDSQSTNPTSLSYGNINNKINNSIYNDTYFQNYIQMVVQNNPSFISSAFTVENGTGMNNMKSNINHDYVTLSKIINLKQQLGQMPSTNPGAYVNNLYGINNDEQVLTMLNMNLNENGQEINQMRQMQNMNVMNLQNM